MESKLVVDLASGHLEVSGSEELIRFIFSEFREQISVRRAQPVQPQEIEASPKNGAESAPRKSKGRKNGALSEVDKELDTTGLEDYFARYAPRTDGERALIFAKFLETEKGISPCSQSQLYTCFFALKDDLKLPEMRSLISNDHHRTKYFTASDGKVLVSKIGENYFSQKLRKKEAI